MPIPRKRVTMKPINIKLDWEGERGTYQAEGLQAKFKDTGIEVEYSLDVVATKRGYLGSHSNGKAIYNECDVDGVVTITNIWDEFGRELMDASSDDIDYLIYNIKSNLNYE